MRRVICLWADAGGGEVAAYPVGETMAGGSGRDFVSSISFTPPDEPAAALVEFNDGRRRIIPWARIISYDLEPESPGIPDSEGGL